MKKIILLLILFSLIVFAHQVIAQTLSFEDKMKIKREVYLIALNGASDATIESFIQAKGMTVEEIRSLPKVSTESTVGFSCISCNRRWKYSMPPLDKICLNTENCDIKCPYCGKMQNALMASKRFDYDEQKDREDFVKRSLIENQPKIFLDSD